HPLTVVADPRVRLPPEAYQRELALARQVEKARAAVAEASAEADALHKELVRRAGAEADASIARAMRALDEHVVAISDAVARGRRPPPKSVTSLRCLGEALDKIAQAVDGADADPTSDARAGLEQAERSLAPTLAAWAALQSGDLEALQGRLRQAGQPVVEVKV